MKRNRIFTLAAIALLLSLLASSALAAHTHVWREVSRTESTCATNGRVTYRCRCGETKVESLPTKGHNYSPWELTAPPTCEEPGVKTHKCSACGRTETRAVVALGHDWDEGVITKLPGYLEPGIRTYTCKNDPTHTKTEEITVLTNNGRPVIERFRDIPDENPLVIVRQPEGGTINYGEGHTMTAEVSGGTEPYTYSWLKRSVSASKADEGLSELGNSSLGDKLVIGFIDKVYSVYEQMLGDTAPTFKRAGEKEEKDDLVSRLRQRLQQMTVFKRATLGTEQTYTAYEAGGYYCVIKDQDGRRVTSDTANVEVIYPIDYQPLKVASERSVYAIHPAVGCVTITMNIYGGIMPYTCVWTKEGEILATSTIESVGYSVLCYNSQYTAEEAGEYVLTVTDSMNHTESDSAVVTKEDTGDTAVVEPGALDPEKPDEPEPDKPDELGPEPDKPDEPAPGENETTTSLLRIVQQTEGGEYYIFGTYPEGERDFAIEIETQDGVGAITYNLTRYGTSYQTVTKSPDQVDRGSVKFNIDLPGTYSVYITDEAGGSAASNEYIANLVRLTVAYTEKYLALYPGHETAEIIMDISDGLPPYTCEWSKDGVTLATVTRESAGGRNRTIYEQYPAAEPGEYKLTVTDSMGNTNSNTAIVQAVDISKPLMIVSQPLGGVYELEDAGDAFVLGITTVNGAGMIHYELFKNGKVCTKIDRTPDESGKNSALFSVDVEGTYYVHVTDSAGRSVDSNTYKITWGPDVYALTDYPLTINNLVQYLVITPDKPTVEIVMSVWGGIGPYSCKWSKGGKTLSTFTQEKGMYDIVTLTYPAAEPGRYLLTVIGSDGRGEFEFADIMEVTADSPMHIEGFEGEYAIFNDSVDVAGFIQGGEPPFDVSWFWDGQAIRTDKQDDRELKRTIYDSEIQVERINEFSVLVIDSNGQAAAAGFTAYKGGLMITQQPVGGTLNENGFLYIYVVMSKEEEDNWPFKYILYKDGSEYSTKITDNTLGRVKVEEPGEYYFQIFHQDRMAFSDKVIVTDPSD